MSQRGSPQRAAPVSRPKIVGSRLLAVVSAGARAAARRPGRVLASVAVIGGASFFAWNATMQQKARHPAPLFVSPKTTASITPAPPRRPDITASTTPAPAPKPDQPAPVRIASADPIGGLLKASEGGGRGAEPKPAAKPAAAAKHAEPKAAKPAEAKPAAKPAEAKSTEAKSGPQLRVASAQKALVKLGYGPIATDGVLGANTRQALERFERDKKLPVTGGLGPRTARQLASLSGMTIE